MRHRRPAVHLSTQDGDAMELNKKRCVPCEGGMPALDASQVNLLMPEVPGWRAEANALHKRYKLATFPGAIAFVDRIGQLAEAEGHHPDFCVHYDVVDVTLSTHAVHGLSENDFILAAKIDQLPQ
jgi:4a-hydroxytetrahydrobiopterin dehydratase